ncbi:conserved hypothetical protein [Hyella patelloides LEGE 07179]|uniref:Uncharacterized protein n=1 Tax=Hyella patelloides LEGE 07179 TaxID=945734 RepID=A0A563VIL9_9CYAN|nr:hypothetical protein [Hyella patelloides]VEP11278.1 conserved hypothetical protein [Hyella patelloides LEGE 07179]
MINLMSSDPTIIHAAKRVYRTYLSIYSQLPKQPFGVVLNKETFKGQLVFREKPILLPGEDFIPLYKIEAQG